MDQAGFFGDVVALCDIDDHSLNAKGDRFPQARKFNDFREMFDAMGDSIDAVTVSTPDHTHAPAALLAMRRGKHVYCQKPLAHTVYETRLMRDTAREMKMVTQMGNQGCAEHGLRRAVEIIRAGAIGPIREVHVWTDRPIWPQAPEIVARPSDRPPVPDYLHWDLFLGPAPQRPYHGAYHPFKWRGWWDFGTGALGDMGCHTMNLPFMALKLKHPVSVKANSGPLNPETYPAWATIEYEFGARGEMPPVQLFWYEGTLSNGQKNRPAVECFKGENPSGSGCLLLGEKGVLYSPSEIGAVYKLLPHGLFQEYSGPEPYLPRNGKGDLGMKEEWIAAIKGGPRPMSNFDYAAALTETVLLGNVAVRLRKKMQWDGDNLRSPDCPEAGPLIRKIHRAGWDI